MVSTRGQRPSAAGNEVTQAKDNGVEAKPPVKPGKVPPVLLVHFSWLQLTGANAGMTTQMLRPEHSSKMIAPQMTVDCERDDALGHLLQMSKDLPANDRTSKRRLHLS